MADYQYLTSTGVVVPDTSNILTEVQDDYKEVFGADLVVDPSTPQGALINAEALARAEVVNNNAALANQINPNVAGGVFLDAIMALLGQRRIAATRTVVSDVMLTGVATTPIPAGTKAQTGARDVFETLSTVVLGMDGTATVDFAAVEYGPVTCLENTLNQVVTNVLGWETVNNPVAGVVGTNQQSDQAARAYRNNTLAYQGIALPEAIISALYNVENVTSVAFLENVAATTTSIQGISMVAHSVWACVKGGADLDVAAALLENKSSGAAWNGGTTINVVEPASGQTYAVKFERPDSITILVRVTTPNGDSDNIKQAVLNWSAGLISSLDGYAIGTDVSPFEISAGINAQYPEYFISKVEISYSSPITYTTDTLTIAIDEIAATALSNITVVIA